MINGRVEDRNEGSSTIYNLITNGKLFMCSWLADGWVGGGGEGGCSKERRVDRRWPWKWFPGDGQTLSGRSKYAWVRVPITDLVEVALDTKTTKRILGTKEKSPSKPVCYCRV